MGDNIAVGDLGAFLHDIAQLSGQLEAPVQGVDFAGLDRQRRPTLGCPGQAGDNAPASHGSFIAVSGLPQKLGDFPLAQAHPLNLTVYDTYHRLAYQGGQLLLQLSDTGLPAIAIDNEAQGGLINTHLGGRGTVALQ